ncbi:MAG: hypothetical protein A2W85_08640 [Bacteroidetes bacterium GWF2_41_31]|nr:MAG: hypothetical protein A2W85_08640 [Bacteroidetes bacterium GWF2_41_31]OFZ09576.1 MAG: hypothetical protein A2338_02110 [Bacteroidetes bacterium RIFOXYB12_FULL_41_6]
MKKLIKLISYATLIVAFATHLSAVSATPGNVEEDTIHIWSSPDLFNVATIWVDEYTHMNPGAKIKLERADAAALNQTISNPGHIGFVTNEFVPDFKSKSVWRLAIGRDIVVPIMSADNQFISEISQRGISPEKFAKVLADTSNQTWGNALNSDQSTLIKSYCIGESSIRSYLAEFIKTSSQNMNIKEVSGIDKLLNEIQNDKNAIGFCRLVDILDDNSQEIVKGISLIPIDMNGNHKVDFFEDIYHNSTDLARGIWIGKYPKALFHSIYSVAGTQPTGSNELAFLNWILTDGQKHLYTSGYSELVYSERQSKIHGLYAAQTPVVDIQNKPMQAYTILFYVVMSLIVILFMFLMIRFYGAGKQELTIEKRGGEPVFGEHSVKAPGGLFFDKSHTWVFMEKDGYVRIGIDDFLQHVTGIITRVKMKKPGDRIKKGELFLSVIQHGKQLDIYSPVSGTIFENNTKLQANPSMINSSPYSDGWVYTIASDNWLKEIKGLFIGEVYRVWIQYEFTRLKDFLSFNERSKSMKDLQLVMQDGGELKDHLLEGLGPEVWEEFQNEFINSSNEQGFS